VLKLRLPLPKFPIVRLPDETNDHFRARVELAIENVMGRYARGEHDVCIMSVPNEGRVNRVFKHAGVPYGPCSEPRSEASKEAAKKRRDNADAGPARKHAKVSGWKATTPKALVVAKGTSATSSKMARSKSTPSKAAPSKPIPVMIAAESKAGAPRKASVAMKAVVLKSAMSPMPKAGVLKIGAGLKWGGTALAQVPKGKQVRVGVAPPIASSPTRLTTVRPPASADSGEGRVAMCMMLGTLPMVSHSTPSSSNSSGSRSIMASPPLVPYMVIFAVLPDISEVSEVEPTPRDDAVEMGPHAEASAFCGGGDDIIDPWQVA
jgi:hypothetical protein